MTEELSSDLDIICSVCKLCDNDKIYISIRKQIKETCDDCESKSRLKILTKVENPFKNASTIGQDLILIPSDGKFLENFNNSSDLHIGIIDNQGKVLEYDKTGLKYYDVIPNSKWNSSLPLYFLDSLSVKESVASLRSWASSISHMTSKANLWTGDNYDEADNNCFDFVLDFIETLGIEILAKQSTTQSRKVDFCERFIVPRTKAASKYMRLHRIIKSGKCHVEKSNKQ